MMMRAAPVVVATQPLSVSPRAPVDSAAANAAATAAQVFAADQRRCSIETMAPPGSFLEDTPARRRKHGKRRALLGPEFFFAKIGRYSRMQFRKTSKLRGKPAPAASLRTARDPRPGSGAPA